MSYTPPEAFDLYFLTPRGKAIPACGRYETLDVGAGGVSAETWHATPTTGVSAETGHANPVTEVSAESLPPVSAETTQMR